ncbi:hypothetical protein BBOV_III009040 [Babesia bovis T2Bo]|uniref:Uncharacterized protein n=1 Tax=Babesia bovis TaxID=5865 RepID=A7APH7_BABBO|nr:hypothetical protein BBOV_III009040 [Babesia bovis T2Bo]EDO08461.1 hypothetical protein BBOV_III009040 [Babesia bovis T2Bo]|eukprot:XP_001612029.1 hypothetical protein [Babesia bovis T2Bo]
MVISWQRPYRLFVRCIRGFEDALYRELISFGFSRPTLIKSHSGIFVESVSLRRLYFISYFSRLTNGVFVEAKHFPIKDRTSFIEHCADTPWSDFIASDSTFRIDSTVRDATSFIKSCRYGSQLVKDGIMQHFDNDKTRMHQAVSLRDPTIRLELHIASGDATLLVDATGTSCSRPYRYKPSISDIDPTIAVGLLNDSGILSFESHGCAVEEYERLCEKKVVDGQDVCDNPGINHNVLSTTSYPEATLSPISCSDTFSRGCIIDVFSGCGTFLIEAAMISERIFPGWLVSEFGFQKFNLYDHFAFVMLEKYGMSLRVGDRRAPDNCLKNKLIGVDSCWEKVESSLYSAHKAGVMDHVKIIQSDNLKSALYDLHHTSKIANDSWDYVIIQLPRLRPYTDGLTSHIIPRPNTKDRKTIIEPDRYYRLLSNVTKTIRKLSSSNVRVLLIAPAGLDKVELETSYGRPLNGGRHFMKCGVPHVAYYG